MLSRKTVEGFRLCDLFDYLVVLVDLILGFLLVLFLKVLLKTLIRVITSRSLGHCSAK